MNAGRPESSPPPAGSVSDSVIAGIKCGEVKMRPRWYFTALTVLVCLSAIAALLILLFVASFIIFTLQETGVWLAPDFGLGGWYAFFASLPWFMVALLLLAFLILQALVRQYSPAYRAPLVYSGVAIALVALAGGYALVQTPLHMDLLGFAQATSSGSSYLIGPLYRRYEFHDYGTIHRGTVVGARGANFVIYLLNGQTSTVVETAGTWLEPGFSLENGEQVVVFGPEDASGTIHAAGIREIR